MGKLQYLYIQSSLLLESLGYTSTIMNPQTFIFIGRSGCGKGTQVELLKKYLARISPETGIFYLETGQRFRDFVKEDHATAERARAFMKESRRQPDFLAVWMWSHVFVEELTKESDEAKHWIIDGTPRALPEAVVLDTAMEFYARTKPYVVHLNVTREWSEKHLKSRGRADDKNDEDIKRRLDWYEKDVVPAIDWYKLHSGYHFLDIHGEQPIEAVHAELIAKVEALG